ncbi:WD40 repeat-like protein [Lactarius hatsudake]|nr:WD40 repeat-like protein [Lactarius hatsudake]
MSPPTLTLDTHFSDDFDFIDGTPLSVQHAMTVTRPPSPSFSFDFSIVSPPSPGPDRNSFPSLPHSRHASSQTSLPSLRWLGTSAGDKRYNAIQDYRTSGRRKANRRKAYTAIPSNISYADLQPLDGEEGELIDEACYVDSGDVLYSPPKFADFLSRLPPEIAIYLLCFLDLSSIIACQTVSRRWNTLASDSAVWRELFYRRQGWGINLDRAVALARTHPALDELLQSPDSPTLSPDSPTGRNIGRPDNLNVLSRSPLSSLPHTPSPWSPEHSTDSFLPNPASLHAPLFLPWRELYQRRSALDARWTKGTPNPRHLRGHADSVYCLEFDSQRIISGSRDQTIKAWDIKTGRCLGTFRGHYGSVLCLKFEKDWDIQGDKKKGFMVSGSSDRRACVWEISIGEGGKLRARVRAVLKGHLDGVLDLRVDDQWIVSCSKDTKIRVWNRETLELHRTLSGHQGPVNAIGLQNGHIVSASGDTKMMLWDIERGTCLRTFDGHDRGLACIEFKDNYIVSGSSDCQIKVWNATTGECIRTLVGHDALVRALALDPATGRLVSASYDKAVKVWDLRTGRLVQQYKQHHLGYIFDVKFDVHRIVSTSHDQRIVVLDFTQNLDAMLFT